MIIWILALLILGLCATVAYFQGAIRASIATVGLIGGALLAGPLSGPVQSLLKIFGVQNPMTRQAIAPAIVFLVILIVAKVIAHTVHRKIEYIYAYKKSHGDQLRWNRVNSRVGLCAGLLNGTIYFLVLLVPFYTFGYLTTQIASETGDPASLRFITATRKQLETTKMDGVVAGLDLAKPSVYDAFDIVGLVYKNPLLESRLSRYPAILTLAERPEFQELANDVEFHNLWQSGAKIGDLLKHPKVNTILTNSEIVAEVQKTLAPDLKDLRNFVETGKSAKYDPEKILGRWDLDLATTFSEEKKRRGNVTSVELKRIRAGLMPYAGATFTATTDGKTFLKRGDKAATDGQPRLVAQGTWTKEASVYKVTMDGKQVDAFVEDGKLRVPRGDVVFVFEQEM